MMLFKLSLKNIKKSIKDYTIYFLTLILGVSIFYVFNALDSQTAMKGISESGYEMVKLMVNMIGMVSVLVAFILGFLIIYANSFLIKRRKKEFGVYMMLGMGKSGISRILFGETMLVGFLSLTVGLILGIFVSQFMSILVAKLFAADMKALSFVISAKAVEKTILYFSIMYLIVLIFNAFAVTKYKLIDLFQAAQKGEKQTMKNSKFAVFVFLIAVALLSYAYYQVGFRAETITLNKAGIMIAMGCVGTFLVFWSLSGFMLNVMQRFKSVYFKKLNAFVLRQLSNNMNTAVFSMTVICLLLFATICAFCSGMSMNTSINNVLREMTPVDICIEKEMDIPDDGSYSEIIVENSHKSVAEMMDDIGFSVNLLNPGYVEVGTYKNDTFNLSSTLGDYADEIKEQFPMLRYDTPETIIGVSDYNKLAALYGNQTIDLKQNQYAIVCDYDNMVNIRNTALEDGVSITVGDYVLRPALNKCVEGYLIMSPFVTNTGFFVVPDEVIENETGKFLSPERNVLAGDYAAMSKKEKQETENILLSVPENVIENYKGAETMSKIAIFESSKGLAVIITFVVLYLGIIFLISGAAILALKALLETADSKGRYVILQKVGTDDKLLNKALFSQLGMFFILPLLLAIIHSIFGMRFISFVLAVFNQSDMLSSIGVTALLLAVVYGCYFMATCSGSRRMINEK